MDDLSVEGIQFVTDERIDAWRSEGLVPRLVGSITRVNDAIRADVGIRTHAFTNPFAHVRGKYKAIRITTEAMGETVAIAGGAEPLATAAAALKDFEHILTGRADYRKMTVYSPYPSWWSAVVTTKDGRLHAPHQHGA